MISLFFPALSSTSANSSRDAPDVCSHSPLPSRVRRTPFQESWETAASPVSGAERNHCPPPLQMVRLPSCLRKTVDMALITQPRGQDCSKEGATALIYNEIFNIKCVSDTEHYHVHSQLTLIKMNIITITEGL